MRLGARSLKTGVAVTMALFIALALHLTPPTMAGIAAAVTTQPSVHRSFRTMVENIQGNIIGAIIAILFVISVGASPIIIGLAVIIVIAIQLKLHLQSTMSLTMVTVIVIMAGETSGTDVSDNFLFFSLDRIILVGIGVLSAMIVNFLFFPPNYEYRLYYSILNQTTELFKWIRLLSQRASEHTKIKDDLATFADNKLKIENYYHWYKEERSYFRKQRFIKYRRTVIFREMITTTNGLHHILRALDRNENAYRLLPDDFKKTLQEELNGLMAYHERVLLKFNGKIRRQQHEKQAKEDYRHKTKLAESFVAHYHQNDNDEWLDLFPFISMIVDYSQHIEHLDRLVESFQTFHTKENRIKFEPEKLE